MPLSPPIHTASSIFLKSLADVGITHAFVNWGSDHPALLEDLERQRAQNGGETRPKIVTCPNEMVALSAAQGYAQVTGKPAAVIIHVDVGTQAMAGAIHNVDRSRTPVLIYAGASPFSSEKEHKGTRNEWIMWLQDIPDQTAIVRQYMRHTAQIASAATMPNTIRRALQIATSAPSGPVYLWARREVMEEEVGASRLETNATLQGWPSIEPAALSDTAANRIASALLTAQDPLIITSHLGRNVHAVPALLALSTLLAIPIVVTCPSALNVPFSFHYFSGITYMAPGTHHPRLATADVILAIDTDIPWIPANDAPRPDARVFVVDGGDPLRNGMGSWHVDAELVCRADSELALEQIEQAARKIDEEGHSVGERVLGSQTLLVRGKKLVGEHEAMSNALDMAEASFQGTPTVPNIVGVLRRAIQKHTRRGEEGTLVFNEAISNFPSVWMHLRSEVPGNVYTSGGSSLGYALGAAVGASLGGEVSEGGRYELVVVIVGDGSFLFGVPGSAYWMARKYGTPFLTIVLNNGGWKSPKLSMLGVHPTGQGSHVSGERLTVGFGPESPDFAGIAVGASAGWAWGKRVGVRGGSGGDGKGEGSREELESAVREAVRVVIEEKRCAVLDCVIESI